MKTLLITDYFYPNTAGGTEKYIYLLAKFLPQNYKVSILSISETASSAIYEDLEIFYIKPNSDHRRDTIRGIFPPNNLVEFEKFIDIQKPDIVHFHTLTTNFNTYHFEICFKKGIATYFSSHIPGHICLRGDLMFHGKTACDGKVSILKCGLCIAKNSEVNPIKLSARFLFNIFSAISPVKLRKKLFKEIESNTTKIITVSEWQKEFLTKNGINSNHIRICRQTAQSSEIRKENSTTTRLGYLGRIDPIKGLHLLINAISKLNETHKISLHIAAVYPPPQFTSYFEILKKDSEQIGSCTWQFNLKESEMKSFFANIDYLIVPSLCFETGPFVIYESLSYKTPVIATNLGGQRELITNGKNGYLFEPSEESLLTLLEKIVNEPTLKLPSDEVYSNDHIAFKMQEIYQE
ncbi:glycosyltransferase [Pedobacter xixiisoli]|uniref:Glycosyltransferase involved in cell wall bisynthesis n=1 Tax=Pedobacter xixiisoli TaxID=1476464 RepID=A0A286A9M7_9SPHI|nr:glycosyltransferase [Pedobacter xixiisoli]SOD18620.1 Glycosyltransferase involved in cell wall bisynthesis [Pedobacter xixiisoli]